MFFKGHGIIVKHVMKTSKMRTWSKNANAKIVSTTQNIAVSEPLVLFQI